jgi:hypothetical protein
MSEAAIKALDISIQNLLHEMEGEEENLKRADVASKIFVEYL